MNAMECLLTRKSYPNLLEPAPSDSELNDMLMAASRASDHGKLSPYRFLTIRSNFLHQFGDLLAASALLDDPDINKGKLDRIRRSTERAPLVVVVISVLNSNSKIPVGEQRLTAGCAAQLLVVAAHAQGYGAIWRTGQLAYSPSLMNALSLEKNESIVGFIYVGTPTLIKPTEKKENKVRVYEWCGSLSYE